MGGKTRNIAVNFILQQFRKTGFAFLMPVLPYLNTLSSNSDQHQFSPNDINASLRKKGVRINKMINKGKLL